MTRLLKEINLSLINLTNILKIVYKYKFSTSYSALDNYQKFTVEKMLKTNF